MWKKSQQQTTDKTRNTNFIYWISSVYIFVRIVKASVIIKLQQKITFLSYFIFSISQVFLLVGKCWVEQIFFPGYCWNVFQMLFSLRSYCLLVSSSMLFIGFVIFLCLHLHFSVHFRFACIRRFYHICYIIISTGIGCYRIWL